MAQGSMFDPVQDELFTMAPAELPAAGDPIAEVLRTIAADQAVRDCFALWADRLAACDRVGPPDTTEDES